MKRMIHRHISNILIIIHQIIQRKKRKYSLINYYKIIIMKILHNEITKN
jgi:hypothetical protein